MHNDESILEDILHLLQKITENIDKKEPIEYYLIYVFKIMEHSNDLKSCNLFFEFFLKLNDKMEIEIDKDTKQTIYDMSSKMLSKIEKSFYIYEKEKDKFILSQLKIFKLNIQKFLLAFNLIDKKEIENNTIEI